MRLATSQSRAALAIPDCAVYDPSIGYIHILEAHGGPECVPLSRPSGTSLTLLFYPPAGSRFTGYAQIWKDLTPQELSGYLHSEKVPPQTKHMDSVDILETSDLIPEDTQFQIQFSTLNWAPGTYTIFAEGIPASEYPKVVDSITITTPADTIALDRVRSDMIVNNRSVYLYNSYGTPIVDIGYLYRGSPYILAANLNQLQTLNNSVEVDLKKLNLLQKSSILSIKLISDTIKRRISTTCSTINDHLISLANYPQGILTVWITAPSSIKFQHSTDESLNFKISHNASGNCSDTVQTKELSRKLIDTLAVRPAIPTNTNTPVDTIKVRLVRFGDTQFITTTSLNSWANTFRTAFQNGTKQYFNLNVQGVHRFSMIQPDVNQSLVTDWYNALLKTPGKKPLNLNHTNERLLATMLYYEENPSMIKTHLKKLYPARQNGEDVTIYLIDLLGLNGLESEALGSANPVEGSAFSSVTDLFFGYAHSNLDAFRTETFGVITYHFDPSLVSNCNGCTLPISNSTEYVQALRQNTPSNSQYNIALHELGHTAWYYKAGEIEVRDFPLGAQPFNLKYQGAQAQGASYIDRSKAHYRKNEYMSYDRDRESLTLTYGDILIERLLARYNFYLQEQP
ncbi:DUF1554 domain-containing protein [Leptospira ellisii]|uniref:DUF1554 domain-containing protein n=2 Tax=Leptospira ellisii TaxID=2023197 RepID=A0AAE4QLK2_9LEPT|nr:DUF1554 domain-containing protein [Leptospira ellisii]MDV6234584.1 DUF1554 domain-containing protein [Leptospira ellisii]